MKLKRLCTLEITFVEYIVIEAIRRNGSTSQVGVYCTQFS